MAQECEFFWAEDKLRKGVKKDEGSCCEENWRQPYPSLVAWFARSEKKAGISDNWWRGKPPSTRDKAACSIDWWEDTLAPTSAEYENPLSSFRSKRRLFASGSLRCGDWTTCVPPTRHCQRIIVPPHSDAQSLLCFCADVTTYLLGAGSHDVATRLRTRRYPA